MDAAASGNEEVALDSVESSSQQPVWTPPAFNFHSSMRAPDTSCTIRPPSSNRREPNFYRSAKWSPDGNCVLATLENHSTQLVYRSEDDDGVVSLKPNAPKHHPSPLLDAIWYPYASTTYFPETTFCYLTSVREQPVKLFDGTVPGKLRASYTIFDHRERFVAPHCMVFNGGVDKLYCGFENAVEVFDFGSARAVARLKLTKNKRNNGSGGGLKGIVSSLSFSGSGNGTMYAAGTLNGSVGLYDEHSGAELLGTLGPLSGGAVTQVQWNPVRTYEVYVGCRRSEVIAAWDVRYRKTVLERYARKAAGTNQRMRFDVSADGGWLVAGDEEGYMVAHSLRQEQEETVVAGSGSVPEPGLGYSCRLDPGFAGMGVGSVSLSAVRPEVVWVTGSRPLPPDSDSENDSGSESEGGGSVGRMGVWAFPEAIVS